MVLITKISVAFGLTSFEDKAEMMCVETKKVSNAPITVSVETAGQGYKQAPDSVCLVSNVNRDADLSIIHTSCRAHFP